MLDAVIDLIGPLSGPAILLIIGTVVFAGFVRGFVGFGSSMIIVLVFSQVLGPKVAVAIAGFSGIPIMIQLFRTAVRDSERRFVLPFGLAACVAAPFGTWILVVLDPGIMKMAIALAVIIMTVMLYRRWQPFGANNAGALLMTGIVSGLLQGAAGVGGPPAVAAALARAGAARQQRANVIGAVGILTACGLVPLWYHGLITVQVVVISVLLFPLYSGATWIGARFFSGRGHRHFRNAALMALAGISTLTLINALRPYLSS